MKYLTEFVIVNIFVATVVALESYRFDFQSNYRMWFKRLSYNDTLKAVIVVCAASFSFLFFKYN